MATWLAERNPVDLGSPRNVAEQQLNEALADAKWAPGECRPMTLIMGNKSKGEFRLMVIPCTRRAHGGMCKARNDAAFATAIERNLARATSPTSTTTLPLYTKLIDARVRANVRRQVLRCKGGAYFFDAPDERVKMADGSRRTLRRLRVVTTVRLHGAQPCSDQDCRTFSQLRPFRKHHKVRTSAIGLFAQAKAPRKFERIPGATVPRYKIQARAHGGAQVQRPTSPQITHQQGFYTRDDADYLATKAALAP